MSETDQGFSPPALRSGALPPPDGLKWVAVDFDNTLSRCRFNLETGDNLPREPMPGSLRKCRELIEHGYKIVIHTSRPWWDYELIEAWLDHYGYPYSAIVCGKLQAVAYVDDRNIDVNEPSWLPEMKQ